MTRLLRRLQCLVVGHPDTWNVWGPVQRGAVRQIAEVCVRCKRVLSRATLRRVGERWIA